MEEPKTAEPTTKRRLPKPAVLAGLGVAALVTLYLATMTVMWGLNNHNLTSAQSDLTMRLEAEQAIVESQEEELDSLKYDLDSSLSALSKTANDKAKYQDFTLLFRNNDEGLLSCADARLEIMPYMKARYLWQPGPLHSWDNDLKAYCKIAIEYFTENVETEEWL